jgi:general secretion pathway protein C
MRHYLTIINLLLITGAVYLGVDAFYGAALSRFESIDAYQATGDQLLSQDKETRRSLSYYKGIADRNLFDIKKTTDEAQPVSVEVEDLKQTELKLKLWGTVTGESGKSYAVIEDTKLRSQNLYQVEDEIQNAVIKEIHREKVVLSLDNEFQILQMEEMKSQAGIQRPARRESRQVTAQQTDISLKREKIESAVSDINSLMKTVRIRPHFKNGQPDGLTLSGIRSKSIFSEMGLRNGDVIVGVDGKKIESVDDALSLYQNLQSANKVQVEIRRRGRLQTIDYNIE